MVAVSLIPYLYIPLTVSKSNNAVSQPINIFIAYAREDVSYLNELRKHLRILEHNKTIKIWYDGEILAGQKWNEEIENQLQRADLFLLLLSADFIYSDYAYGKEMKEALARHERGEAILIPIIARACAWDMTPLAALQAPVEGKALGSATGPKRDDLYEGIVRAVAKSVARKQQDNTDKARYFADEAAWKEALQLNSINGFQRYLEQHGRHASEANKAIMQLNGEPDMVFVQGGTFTMGCKDGRDKDCYDNEKPAHEVR
ncbi:MAG: TIR domain-containing protein, partial [Saprospiraceae bacterium]|nr:TIR domain-containing protein [Saprospiraceae bacterium]